MYKQSATYNNYMQDPTSQQGFNRYAYCMYDPLKYVDPSGERQMGWVGSTYQYEQAAKHVFSQWNIVYDDIMMKQAMTLVMANTIYSEGTDACGGGGGSGNHGSGGGDQDGPNKQRPLIFIRTVTTDNDLPPIYNFIIFNSNESSGNNTSTYTSEL